MVSYVDLKIDDEICANLKTWNYGENWPIVYVYYNATKAYVGETLDARERTIQHSKEGAFADFTNVLYMTKKTFNKSVILDMESNLIKHMGTEGTRTLINGNHGIVNHNYFYKEAYEDDFKEIWNLLREKGIVSKSLIDIENSELYKYSPYKSLTSEQKDASYKILKKITEINNATQKSLVEIIGGAGTGKTILAVYLIKLISDIKSNLKVWNSIDDANDADIIEKLSKSLTGIEKIGFVVPMVQLRNTMKEIFKSINGLSEDMIYSPEEVVNESKFDVLIVDEAHRLYKRKHLPGAHIYAKFDKINKELMGDDFKGNEDDLTELDWIIRSSRIQVLFYDNLQEIRSTDIGSVRFDEICAPVLYDKIPLVSQMRCKGGTGYYEYVKKILDNNNVESKEYVKIDNYDLKVVDSVDDLYNRIKTYNDKLCKVVAGPGWSLEEDICIDNNVLHWGDDITSIHKIQGFDLDYAGVVFGKEVFYNKSTKRIEVNKKELKDSFTKSDGDDQMRRYILNIYLTLMTRGIHGTYVYAVDDDLREYLKEFFS
ncbi:MAG: DUF2075 domain-containing protein [Lachnospiraceae bacterium]|nr:DUF2075 domain-containing protein [Lachnospiraceae bacterium]